MVNKKIENGNKWTNRDWLWLLSILIGIIILLIASIFANSLKVETNFSIISSAVSIALALVAIFFALKQDSDNKRVNDNVSGILNNIVSEMGVVKHQVNKLSDKDIAAIKEDTMAGMKEDIGKESYNQKEVNDIVKKAVDEISNKFRSMTEKNMSDNTRKTLRTITSEILEIENELIEKYNGYSYDQINDMYEIKYGRRLPEGLIIRILSQ